MKKFLLSFLALFAACLSFTANADYTIEFLKKTSGNDNSTSSTTSTAVNTVVTEESKQYVTGNFVTATSAFPNNTKGFKLASNKNAGKIKFNLSEIAKVSAKSIKVLVISADDNCSFTLSLDNTHSKTFSNVSSSEAKEYTYEPETSINLTSLELSAASKNRVYIQSITVVEAGPTQTEGKLAFAKASYETTIGEDFVSPQPSTWEVGEGATITYTSSDTNVADVGNNGNLTIKAAGTTTTTVNATETETHTAATASYTLTVKAPAEPVEANFSIAGVKDGVITIEINEESLGVAEFFYTPANIDSSKLELIYNEDTVVFEANEEVANKLDFAAFGGIGEYPVTVSFAGDDIYNKFDYVFTVNVVKKALNITFDPAEVVVVLDGTAKTPVASPALDNIEYKKIFNVTENRDATEDEIAVDKSGIIAAAIGEYIVTAESAGNDIYNAGEGTFKIIVEPKTQDLLLDKEQYEVSKLNEPVEIVYVCEEGAVVKFEATPAEGITFEGNTFTVTNYGTYTVTATATAPNFKDATATFTVIAENPFKVETFTDVLDKTFFKATDTKSSTYQEFNGTSSLTDISYKAYMSPQDDNKNTREYFAIREADTPHSGIIVTKNQKGFSLKRIEIEFQNSKSVDVYYLDTEFTAIDCMWTSYTNGPKANKLSNSSLSNTNSTFNVDSDKNIYYVGLRSSSGSCQIKKISLTWEKRPELTFAEAADFEVDHNFQPYEELSGKHHAEHAIDGIQLYEEKYHEAVKATISHDEAAWDFTGRYTEIPGNLTDEEAEAFHKEHHYDFFVAPEISEFNTNFVNFNASHAGKYLLTLDVKDEYKDYLDCTPKTYVINVKPSFSTEGFTVDNSLGFAPDAMNELRLFVTKEENGEMNGYNVAVYTEKGWQLSSNHDLSQVFIDARYRNLYYQIENGDANNSDPEYRPATKAEAQAMPEGYIHYDAKKGFDLSNAKSLSLIAVENGVQSAPSTFAFNDEKIETAVEEIETEDLPTEYYSIEGIRVEAPLAPGIYVARRGAEAKVIMVK